MRKLASIQRILSLDPIDGADLIELARIQGWQCVVKKGEFKVGDLGIYLEIDAVPPATDVFKFLWKGKEAPSASFRIHTMRLRGCLSQGLMLPLATFAETFRLADGTDVSELLGVTKYEPAPPAGSGAHIGNFHPLTPKTDEPRLQSNMGVLDEIRGLPYYITEKCDGTSITLTAEQDGTFCVYSRNHQIADSDNLYWHATRRYNVKEALQSQPHLALQCEVVGPGIQKNRLGLKNLELRAFNLYDKGTGEYCSQEALQQFCQAWNIPTATVLEWGEEFQHTLGSLLKLAEGYYPNTKNDREGVVVRTQQPMRSRVLGGDRLSFKVINNNFLLKGGD